MKNSTLELFYPAGHTSVLVRVASHFQSVRWLKNVLFRGVFEAWRFYFRLV